MKLLFSSAIALVIVAGSTTAAPAEVQSNLRFTSDGPTATVNFADLNLASPGDAKILLDRIHVTARRVCLHANPGNWLEALQDQRRCLGESYNNGIAIINSQRGIDVEALAARASTSREVVGAD